MRGRRYCPVRGRALDPVLFKAGGAGCAVPAQPLWRIHRLQDRPRSAPPCDERGSLHQQADDRMSGSCRAGQGRADAGQDTSHQNSDGRRYGLRPALPEHGCAGRRRPLYADSMQKHYLGHRRPGRYVRRQRLSVQPVRCNGPCAGGWCKRQKPDRMAVWTCQCGTALECVRHLYAGAAACLLHGGGRQRRKGVPDGILHRCPRYAEQAVLKGLPVAV